MVSFFCFSHPSWEFTRDVPCYVGRPAVPPQTNPTVPSFAEDGALQRCTEYVQQLLPWIPGAERVGSWKCQGFSMGFLWVFWWSKRCLGHISGMMFGSAKGAATVQAFPWSRRLWRRCSVSLTFETNPSWDKRCSTLSVSAPAWGMGCGF